MAEYCTCGTLLVEDARFCHKCGRPTSGEPEVAIAAPPPVVDPTPPAVPRALASVDGARISFSNPVALRIAFAAAAVSLFLDLIPYLGLLCVIWSMGAGFLAVWLYRRRTGLPISVPNGARLGWITGVFTSVLLTVMMTVTILGSGGKLVDEYRKQMTSMAAHDASYQQALDLIQNPTTFATLILATVVFLFVLLSAASIAGGALGARLSNKE
jgi:hypothetical protein